MKKITLFKCMVVLLVLPMGAKAQELVVQKSLASGKTKATPKVMPQIDMSKYQLFSDDGEKKIYIPQRKMTVRKALETEMATVTCRLEYDPNVVFPTNIMAFSDNYEEYFWLEHNYASGTPNTIICSVPVGSHDFKAEGFRYPGGLAWVIKEEVFIKKDTTLVFNFSDAQNKYSVETYKPNGDLCEEWIIDYSGEEPNVIRETNIDVICDFFMLNLKGVGCVGAHSSTTNLIQPGCESSSTMYINDLSDRYRLTDARTVVADDTWYICKYETENMLSSTTLKNNPASFICYEEQFVASPAGNPNDGGGTIQMGAVISLDNVSAGTLNGTSNVKAVDGIVRMYVDAPQSNALGQGHINIMPYAGLGDRYVEISQINQWEDEEGNIQEEMYTTPYTYAISGLPVVISKDGLEYVNASHDQGGNFSFHVAEEGDIMEYPGNLAFGYTSKQKLLPFGSGCPINAFLAQNYFYQDLGCVVGPVQCCYIGRYGEVRIVDLSVLKAEIKYNDKVICNDYSTIDMDMWNFFIEQNTDGVIDANFTNENVVVDELPGKNITTVHYNWGADDMTAPTLQMLWFKNLDNNVIDRFDKGVNGTLEFAGGDFNFHMLPDKSFFDCKEQTVQVNYSPYNKNEWAALEVEEIPENFFMPGFGYFYRGSLKDVTGQAEKGWFDLKIRLEDEAGNWQEQVISPAFRIDDLVDTGISQLRIDNGQLTIPGNETVYDVMGRRVADKSSKAMKGIQIVRRQNGDVRKVVVR